MIAARQIAFGKAAGAKKPYDAEIEYLESTGTQWIDTGVILNTDIDFAIDFQATDLQGYNKYLLGGNSFRFSYYYGYNLIELVVPNTSGWTGPNLTTKTFNRATFSKQGENYTYANKTKVRSGGYAIDSGTCGLFAWKSSGNGVGFLNSRIYSAKIGMRDFIPVRVGNVGYMYDRVSGQLFGNQGTGAFVLGPDIIDYTAKDYIQDGLVAMWDGIENAGWGVHDPSATVWKDLAGGIDVTANRAPTWRPDAFAGDGGTYFTTNSTVPAHTILNGGYTVELGGRPTGNRRVNGGLIGIGVNNDSRTFWMWEKARDYDSFLDSIQTAQIAAAQPSPSPDVATSWRAVFDGSRFRLLANGTECINRSAQTAMQQEYGTYIGRIGTYGSTGSDILFVRLYSRALPDEEIAYNDSIDKARFGL